MKFSLLTTNGRVTIPAPLRKKYNLTPGIRVRFTEDKDGICITTLATPEEIKANAGFLGTTSRKPGKKGKMLKSLMKEKQRERELLEYSRLTFS